eukprot:gene3373-3862_t
MVGLFKKLGKKKSKRTNKNINSASEDESATEDESSDRLSYLNTRNLTLSTNSNGLRTDTPNNRSQPAEDESCSETESLGRNSFISGVNSPASEMFNDMNISLDVQASFDNDDSISITSADEGSLFGEDVLSAFEDGQLSLQQFLQSPHLSRCEDRIIDEELGSVFSDSRSIESSNFYSDSSSDDDTDARDKELDRLAGELFGDYGDKFLNSKDPRVVQKTSPCFHHGGNDHEFIHKSNRFSYCSVGNETITNSCDDVTVCNEPTGKDVVDYQDFESANHAPSSQLVARKIQETGLEDVAQSSKVSVQLYSSTSSSITFRSPCKNGQNKDLPSNKDIPSQSKDLPSSKDLPPSKYNPPNEELPPSKYNPPNEDLAPKISILPKEDPPKDLSLPATSFPRISSTDPIQSSNVYTSRRLPKIVPKNLPISPTSLCSSSPSCSPLPGKEQKENGFALPGHNAIASQDNFKTSPSSRMSSRSQTPAPNAVVLDSTPTDRASCKTPLQPLRADTPALACSRASPCGHADITDTSPKMESRPCSTTSSSSQREVAIVDNTVMSMQGNYVIKSEKSEGETEAMSRGKSPRSAEKVDPWLSYLPTWKASTCNSVENSPSRSTGKADERCSSRMGEPLSPRESNSGYEASEEGSRRPSAATVNNQENSDEDRYIRFSSLQLDFFIPPPPTEEDAVSAVQDNTVDAVPFNLEWDYEIPDSSPTLTPSSSVIYLGDKEGGNEEIDPIAESLLGLLPIADESFQSSVSNALGEIITEIVSSRQKFSRMTKVLELQDQILREQKKQLYVQSREISELKTALSMTAKTPTSPRVQRRGELKSYPATGRRSKELVDLENTLDKLLFQCSTLQRNSTTDADLQVFQPIDAASVESCEAEMRPGSASGSEKSVKTLLYKKMPESPANHVQIVPAKGVVYNSCKEIKEDLNAIGK